MTDASEAPEKTRSPLARKPSLPVFSVEATNPLVSMTPVLPMRMPFSLISATWPLEIKVPNRSEGIEPTTRLSTAESAPGWRNWASSFAPIEKESQSITVR